MPDTIQTLEKQRKKLHILQIMRQIGRFTVAAVLLVSVVVFLFYLIFCLYLIFIAEDTETTITNVPWILKWMDDTTISDDLFSTLWVVAVCADIALLIVYAKYNCKFRALYKETFVMPVIQDFFEQVQYRYNEGFHSQQIRQFSLVKNGNNIISEDYILGTYRNVRFEQAEVIVKNSSRFALISGNVAGIMLYIRNMLSSRTINRKTKAGKRKERIKTYFAGQMLTFSFPKEHVKSLHVFSHNYKNRPNLDAASSHIVKMENVVFNEHFDVLASNEHDAFYVLTPHMQNRMLVLLERFESIAFHFQGDTLYLGFNSQHELFDMDIRKPIDYQEERRKVFENLKIIQDIIDIMLMRQKEPVDTFI